MSNWFRCVAVFGSLALAAPGAAQTAAVDDGPAVFGGSATSVTPADRRQVFAGELDWDSMPSWSASPNLATATIQNLCVRNLRYTDARDVSVELWASRQIPSMGGNLAHETFATFYLGTIPAGQARCTSTTVPMTPPLPGKYWLSAALLEGTGSSRTLHRLYVQDKVSDFGGPFYNGSLYFETPAAYYVTDGGAKASVQIQRIRNASSSATRRLRFPLCQYR